MKVILKFPMPDHYPKAAFEYLTGYGYIADVDPVLDVVTYELEAKSLVELVRRVDEIEHEIGCYGWWTEKIDLFEQAQDAIDSEKIGILDINASQVKYLKSILKKVEGGRSTTITVKEREVAYQVLQLLDNFKPMEAKAMKS